MYCVFLDALIIIPSATKRIIDSVRNIVTPACGRKIIVTLEVLYMEVAQQILALDARYNSFRMSAFPQHSTKPDFAELGTCHIDPLQERFTYGDGTSC